MLKRKIDDYLINWKEDKDKFPLVITGARQIGKSTSIAQLGSLYDSFIKLDFKAEPKFKGIFKDGYRPTDVIRNISLLEPSCKFIPHETLIFFDEIQDCPDALSCLKFFKEENQYDIICSGSLLGTTYKLASFIPVGFKREYKMESLDFEEFLWANGYSSQQIEDIYQQMLHLSKLNDATMFALRDLFKKYIFVGGMPKAVDTFIKSKNFSTVFSIQDDIYKTYQEDIIQYVDGLDAMKVKNVYTHISSQLAKENHKFQITKLRHGARSRDYIGVSTWLNDAGIVLIANNLDSLELPLSAYENCDSYRLYYSDHSTFISTLDKESKQDLIINNNYEIYYGALYESLIASSLIKQGFDLYYYTNSDSTIELDFVIRVKNEIVPIEVKKKRGRNKSLRAVLDDSTTNIKHAIKFSDQNIGYENGIITFPYFLSFLLHRFIKDSDIFSW